MKLLGLINAIELILIEYAHLPFVKIVQELKPQRIMEIGVAQGHGAERMIKASGRDDIKYYGFDLFGTENSGVHLSGSMLKISERLRKLCANVYLFSGDTRETLPQIVPTLPQMDFIYIDGGHSYEVCKSDWENIKQLMHPETVVVFDDVNERNAGVKEVVDEIKNHHVTFIELQRFWLLHMPTKNIQAVVRNV